MLLRAPPSAPSLSPHLAGAGVVACRPLRSVPPIRCCSNPSLSESSFQSVISKVHSYNTVDFEDQGRRGRRRAVGGSPPSSWNTLYRRIATSECATAELLERWEVEEWQLTKWETVRIAKELRKFRRFELALQVYDWMTSQGDRYTATSSDFAIHLDLISKVRGVVPAEEYFSMIPERSKDKRTYGALLNAYGQAKLKDKAEATFEKMRNNGLVKDALAFNVMMTLYMNVGEHDKIEKIINQMKESNIVLDIYTYNIWITNAAATDDAEEMERILNLMSSEGKISANWTTFTTLASMYIRMGNFVKAESCLKDAELRMTGRNRNSFQYLIGLYSNIGKKEDVYRIWNLYKRSFPSVLNVGYQIMISSLIKLGDGSGAEMIYEEWFSKATNYDPRVCNILIGWYSQEGLVIKAKDTVDRLIEKGGKPKPSTWEILAEGYLKLNKAAEALASLKEASCFEGQTNWRPKPENVSTLIAMLKGRRDIEGIEELMEILRRRGCHDRAEYAPFFSPYTLS